MAEEVAVLGLALVLFSSSLLLGFIAFWIIQGSESIRFDLSARGLSGKLRELTNSLVGWLVIALLFQAGTSLLLSAVFPVIWAFS
jgi:hypothetical protein